MEFEQVKELINIFEKTDLNDMEVRLGDALVHLNRSLASQDSVPLQENVSLMGSTAGQPDAAQMESIQAESAADAEAGSKTGSEDARKIKAPIVGTFYRSSAPDQPPYIQVGDTVAVGDVVCIIEAMKFMNEVTSEVSGTVAEILVEDGQFVEFGQELFRLQ